MFLRFIQNNKLRALLFYALILFLPTQFGKHFWPSFAFLDGIRIDYLSPTLYFTDLLALAFILSCLWIIRISKIVFPILLVVAIGVFYSAVPLSGWYQFAKFVEYLLLGVTIAWWFDKKKYGMQTGIFLGIGILAETLLAFAQFFHQGSLGGLFYFFGERTFSADTPGIANAAIHGQLILRPYGTLPHPNVLGGFLLISMVLFFAFLRNTKNKKQHLFLWTVLLVGTAGLLVTLSRSAIGVFLFVVIIFILWKFRTKKRLLVFFSGIILTAFILVGILFPLLPERFSFSFSDESIVQRQQLMETSLKMIRTHPLFGLGFGNFSTNATQNLSHSGAVLLQPVHNIFLFLAQEGGLLFLFFCLWFGYQTFQKLLRLSNTKYAEYALLLILCLVAVIGIGQADHYFVTLQQGQLLTTVVLGLSWNAIFFSGKKT